MKLSLDTLGKSFSLSLRPAANLTAFFHLIIGFAGLLVLSFIGDLINVPEVIFLLGIIGMIFFVFVIFRCAFILNQMAISSLRDNKNISFGEAQTECNRKQLQLFLLPGIFVGIILFEYLIYWLFGLISPDEQYGIGGFFLTILAYPFYIINFVLWFLLVLGGGIFIPIMIDQNTGAIGSIKGIALSIKQQFLRLLIVQIAVAVLALVVFAIFYGVDYLASMNLAPYVIGLLKEVGTTATGIMMFPSAIMNMFGEGNALMGIAFFFRFIFVIIIFSAIAAYLFNVLMTLYSSFYLGFLKDHVNFKAEISIKKK